MARKPRPAPPPHDDDAPTTKPAVCPTCGKGTDPSSADIGSLLRPHLPSLIQQAATSDDPNVAARLIALLERIEAAQSMDESERDRAMAALEMVRQAERLTPDAMSERAVRVLELELVTDPARLEPWAKRMRIAAGQARPPVGMGDGRGVG